MLVLLPTRTLASPLKTAATVSTTPDSTTALRASATVPHVATELVDAHLVFLPTRKLITRALATQTLLSNGSMPQATHVLRSSLALQAPSTPETTLV